MIRGGAEDVPHVYQVGYRISFPVFFGFGHGTGRGQGAYLQSISDGSVIVRWRTDMATDSVVRYGPDSATLISVESVSGTRTEHTVQVSGLSPLTEYFYSVGDSVGPMAGGVSFHFNTAPTPGTATRGNLGTTH